MDDDVTRRAIRNAAHRDIDRADLGHQRTDLVFPMEEFQARVDNVRARMSEMGLDAVMLTTPENIFYLCGYQTLGYWYFQALVLPVEGCPFMIMRKLETPNVAGRTYLAYHFDYEDQEDPALTVRDALREFGLDRKRVGVEFDSYFLRLGEFERIRRQLPGVEFHDCSGVVEDFRVVKSPLEIEHLRKAGSYTRTGIEAALAATRAGATENHVAAAFYDAALNAGTNYMALPPFVASGPRSYLSHATFDRRVIEPNEFVLLEGSGCHVRYHSPSMRTIFTGRRQPWLEDVEAVLQEALRSSIVAMKPGATAGEIDRINQAVISKNAFGGRQTSRTGYSIGIAFPPDWGEGHIVSLVKDDETVLREGMAFHVLSYIEIPSSKHSTASRFGLTDSVRVTPEGGESLVGLPHRIHFTES